MLKLIDFQDTSLDQITAMFVRMKHEGLIGDLIPLDLKPQNVVRNLQIVAEKRGLIGAVLVDDYNAVHGIFVGATGYQWYNPAELVFNEMVLFIHPDHRRGNNFKKLYTHVAQKCKQQNVQCMQIGNAMRVNSDRFGRVLNHYDFKTYPVYRKEL